MNDAAHVRTRGTAIVRVFGLVLLAWSVAAIGSLLAPSEAQAYPATANYSCPSGGTLSGTTCTETVAATWNNGYYYCPSGGSLSGTTCTQSQSAYYQSGYYYCPSGGSLSGSTCYTSSSYGASWSSGYYYCPSGGSLSGTTCSTSTTRKAFANYGACPSGYGTAGYVGECWRRNGTTTPCPSGYSYMGSGTFNDVFDGYTYTWSRTGGCYSASIITMRPISYYSCPQGGTVSGSNCIVSSSYAASYQSGYYYCPSGGSLSGSTCTVSSSYAASYQSAYYYCSSGWSLSGSTCYYSYGASYQSGWYTCSSGYTLSGSSCTRTYAASVSYSCPSGGVLSGTRCLPTNVSVSDGTGADVAYDNSPPLDANWTAATGGTISTYEWCFTTSSCATGAVVNGSTATRVASSGATVLSSGITYLACVRALDSTGDYGAWACSNGARFDAVAPPTVTTLATAATTLTAPALTWTIVSDPGSGTAYYRVYRGTSSTGPWTQISTNGAPVSGAYTDAAAPWGTSWYKVQAVDAAGNEAAASNIVSARYHRAPTVTLISPANGTTNLTITPTLSARHDDLDGDVGSVAFQLCSNSTCSAIASSTTNAGVAAGATTNWAISPALPQGTQYWWRAQTTDSSGAASAWSGIWTFTTTLGPTITDNQTGDLTWRRVNDGTYDVDFVDPSALDRFEVRVWSGAGQTGTMRQDWTLVAGGITGTSYTANWALPTSTWAAMAEGINYVSVQGWSDAGGYSVLADAFEVRKDTVAAPAVTTLAAPASTTAAPALTWTPVTDATSGVAFYRVYRGTSSTGPWTLISTDGAVTAGAFTDAAATINATHWYKVQAVDQAANEATTSNVVSSRYHRAPTITLVSPADAATGLSPTPTLSARHDDLDGDIGSVDFQLCSTATCSSVAGSTTNANVATGATTNWTISPALTQGTQYWWRARTMDSSGVQSAWSAIRTFTTTAGPTITDNQAGDATWRNANSGSYDVDIADPLGLDRFEVRVWSAAGQTGTLRQDWTLVAGSLAGTSYTTNWALPASTWTALAQGINYVSVRAFSDVGAVTVLTDAFEVRKDTTAAAPGIVNDGPATDLDWWPSTSSLDMNWSASTGEAGLSGVLRYEYCISTLAGCGGIVARTWTNGGAATSVTAIGLTLTNGSQYFVAMRMVDVAGNTSGVTNSDAFRVDALAPTAPTLVTPTAAATITANPTFTATYNDPAPASAGQLEFQVCSNSTCSAVVASGTSAAGLAPGANGSWTPAPLAGAAYWWRARATDSASTTGPWTATRALTLTYPPTAPVLVSPATGIWLNTATPTLTATFGDPDAGATGQLGFQLCPDSTCSSIAETGTSAAGIASGANGTWTPSAIPNGATRWWRVNGSDGTSTSAWSVIRSVRIDVAPPPPVNSLAVPSPTNTDPALTWSTVADGESGTAYYRVFRSTSSGTLGTQINANGATTTGSYVDASGLLAGTYYYTVQAVDSVGNVQVVGNNQAATTFAAPLYLRSTTATNLGGDWRIELVPGTSANAATSPKIGQNAGYVQLLPGQAPNAPTFSPTLPTTPSGDGWIFEQAPGTNHQAGTWRFWMTTIASRTHTGYVNVRAWKVTTSAGAIASATPLSGWTQGTTDVGALITTQTHPIDIAMPQLEFATGEYLYVEYWENVTVAASGGGANNTVTTFQVNTSAERIEPTPPIPPGPTIIDNQVGDDTWRTTNAGTYDVDFSDFTALASFETNVWSATAQTGTERQAWTQVATLSGTAYATNWALPAATWSALAEGTNYVSVRVTNSGANTATAVDAFHVRKDTVAPGDVTATATTPTLIAPVVGWGAATDATSGVAHYRVFRGTSSTGPWTQVNVDGATTGTSFTDASAPYGTHYYLARAVDQAGNVAAGGVASGAVTYHRAPAVPTLVSPASAATGVALAPQLSATYADPDASSGTVAFQVCTDSACSSVVRSGASTSVASGTTATWTVPSALSPNTTYWFRAMSTDAIGATSAWATTRSFTTVAAPTITDNQTGDLAWRSTNSGTYDVDFADGIALASFETNVWSAPAQTGTQRQGWTVVASPSGATYTTNWALPASTWTAMPDGVSYVSVRATNSSALSSTLADAFEVRKDTVAPPAITTLTTTTPTLAAPALTWTTVTDATSGVAHYRVYRGSSSTGPWTLASVDGAVTSGSFTDSGATVGQTSWYRAHAVDSAGNESATGVIASVLYHRAPNAPTPTTPADGAAGVTPLPTLAATHVDADAHAGTVSFELCSSATCATVLQSGSSTSVASGASATWAVPTALAQGTQYWWRARATDQHGAVSGWSATSTFTTSTGPTITDNQSGDLTWRSTDTGTYDVDATDPLGLDRIEIRVWSAAGQTGTMLQDWTLLAGSLTGTSFTTNWSLPATTWATLAQGVNYVSVRAFNDSSGSSVLTDAFEVRKDTSAGAPTGVNDGSGADVDWVGSTSTIAGNWTAPAGEAGMSGVLRYEYCISTLAGCGGTVARTWANGTSAPTITATGLSLVDGAVYFLAVRTVDNAGNTSAATSSDSFRVDATAPSAPTLVSPAADATVTAVPTFTATYVDPAPASPGQLTFELCSDAACASVVDGGTSAAGITTGSNGTWAPATLAGGTYWWRARGTDSAGTSGAWSAARALAVSYPPTAPTLIAPADGIWVASDTPALTARFQDPDTGATGQLAFQLCLDAGCSSVAQTGTSSAGIATGSNGSWTPSAIANGATRHWRTRGNDGTSDGPWSVARSVRIDIAPPPAVTTLAAPSTTSSSPALTWTPVVDAESGTAFYRVYRSATSGTLGTQINADGATTTGSLTDTSTLATGTWHYTVRAVDSVGNEQTVGNTPRAVSYIAPIYFRAATSLASAAPTAWLLERTAGTSANTATSPRIGRNQGCYIQFQAGQAPVSPACPAALPAAPSGGGWLMDAAPGETFAAGNWRTHLTTSAQRAHSGFLTVRAWKVTLGAGAIQPGATALSTWTQGATDVGSTTTTTGSYVDLAMPQITFAAGEYLYVEVWERLVSESGNNSTSMTLQVDTTAERIEPTAPVPPMNVISTSPGDLPQALRGATVQVNGSGFASGATVDLGAGVTVTATTWVSATRIDVTVDVDSAATIGPRTVTVTNPDTSAASGTGIFAVRAPSISMAMTALGYDDTTRTTSGTQTAGFGTIDIGTARAIGPAGSGQATPGAALELTLTSDTDAMVQATATDLGGSAGASIPAGQLAWRTAGTSNAWAPFSTTASTVEAAMAPGTTTFAYDLQLSIPADQRAGTYAGSVAWTVVARP